MTTERRSASRGSLAGAASRRRTLSAGPVRRAVRAAIGPAAALAAVGVADVAPAQLIPDAPRGAVTAGAERSGGFFGLVADGPAAASPGRGVTQVQYAPQPGYPTQPGVAPQYPGAAPSGGMTTPRQMEAYRQQQAYRQQVAMRARANVGGPVAAQLQSRQAQVAQAPARVSVLGAVMQPRTYEFAQTAPDLSVLLERAGGLTGKASGAVRLIRNGRQAGAVQFTPGMRLPLAAGDVILCDPAPEMGPRERHTAYVALVGLTDRPVVLKLKDADANVPALLESLNLPPESMAAVGVLPPAGSAGVGPGGTLPDGTVVSFGPGSVTPAQWRQFRDVPFGDLVQESAPEPVSPAGASQLAEKPAPPAADEGFTITPRRSATADPQTPRTGGANGTTGTAATPPLTLSGPVDAVTDLPSPRPGPAYGTPPSEPTFGLAGPTAPGGPATNDPNLATDVTHLYDDAPEAVAMLPAPGDSPFYGGEGYGGESDNGEGPALADAGSHLMVLDDAPGLPGLSAPAVPEGLSAPGGLAAPGGLSAEPWRVAAGSSTPGRYSDAAPATPPAATPLPAPSQLTTPRPMSGGPARPIPAEPVAPSAESEAGETNAAAKSEAGFPWLPAGFGLGAVLGGGAAAAVALRRRKRAGSLGSAPTTAPPAPQPTPAPTEVAAAETGAVKPTAAAAPVAPAAPKPTALDDLIADRLPVEEEAVRLPESVALHGRSAGMTRYRLQPAEAGPGAPSFAKEGAAAGAGADRSRRAETVSV